MPPRISTQSRWFIQELQPHEDELRGWLENRFPAGLDIDDIIQEAFVATYQAHEKGTLKSPKAFSFGAARNLALASVRSRRIRGYDNLLQTEDCELRDEEAGVREEVTRNQELQILTVAIQALPDPCRQVFTIRKIYGMKQREIVKKLGISTHTVNAQITI